MKSKNWAVIQQSISKIAWIYYFIAIAIVIIGFLYWNIYVYGTYFGISCSMPDLNWLSKDSVLNSPFWFFVVVVIGFLILNISFFWNEHNVSVGKASIFIINHIAILCLLFVLFKHYQFMFSYRDKMNSLRYDLPNYYQMQIDPRAIRLYGFNNNCHAMSQFMGDWEVIESYHEEQDRFGAIFEITEDVKFISNEKIWPIEFFNLDTFSSEGIEKILLFEDIELIVDSLIDEYFGKEPIDDLTKAVITVHEINQRISRRYWLILKADNKMLLREYLYENSTFEKRYTGNYALMRKIPDPSIR